MHSSIETPEDGDTFSGHWHLFQKSAILSISIDYRIMTMSDKDGNEIFSTDSLPLEER